MSIMPVTNITTDEIQELKRLSGDDQKNFTVFMLTYQSVKTGLRGKKAIEKINDSLPPESHIDIKGFNKIVRAFREKSKLLEITKEVALETIDPMKIKIKNKINDILEHGITMEKIKKANLKDSIYAMGVLFDKNRIMEGKSTENIAVAGKIEHTATERILKEMDALRHDLDGMNQFAEKHGLKVPSEEFFEGRLKKSGEIMDAEPVVQDAEIIEEEKEIPDETDTGIDADDDEED